MTSGAEGSSGNFTGHLSERRVEAYGSEMEVEKLEDIRHMSTRKARIMLMGQGDGGGEGRGAKEDLSLLGYKEVKSVNVRCKVCLKEWRGHRSFLQSCVNVTRRSGTSLGGDCSQHCCSIHLTVFQKSLIFFVIFM